jgi:hypothetical protein
MIRDLSETLRAILTQPGLPPELAGAQIVFDRPAEPFNPTQTTVDLFLYDLRENHDLRTTETALPLACTYLITAWPVGGPELALREQQLLSDVLEVLSNYRTIPASLLKGKLAGQDPLPQILILHPEAIQNTSDFWTSLGNKLRPSLSVTVTIAVPPFQPAESTLSPPAATTAQPSAQQPTRLRWQRPT